MLVTILSVAFNSGATIARTIESVLNQSYGNIEYIIIDGASKDNTVEIARSYLPIFEEREGRSLTVVSESDRGMYDGPNKGAKMAHGVLVGQINSDDWYEKDAVETMVNIYKKTHYDVAWGSICIKKTSGDMIKHAKIGRLWTTIYWCHPGMFSRKEVLQSHPYPLESMYDDFDYITRCHQEGLRLVTTDKVISYFTFGGMSTKKSFSEVKRRVGITYSIYRKYGMSRWYLVERWVVEVLKYVFG